MVSWRTCMLLGAASLIAVSFACASGDSPPVALTHVPQERSVPTTNKVDVTLPTTVPFDESAPTPVPASDATAGSSSSVKDKQGPTVAVPIQPTSVVGKDLTESQYKDIDAQIAELRKSPDILAECARENGDSVPAPGSTGEIEWYAAAAIKYAACASSKTTGVDWGR